MFAFNNIYLYAVLFVWIANKIIFYLYLLLHFFMGKNDHCCVGGCSNLSWTQIDQYPFIQIPIMNAIFSVRLKKYPLNCKCLYHWSLSFILLRSYILVCNSVSCFLYKWTNITLHVPVSLQYVHGYALSISLFCATCLYWNICSLLNKCHLICKCMHCFIISQD